MALKNICESDYGNHYLHFLKPHIVWIQLVLTKHYKISKYCKVDIAIVDKVLERSQTTYKMSQMQ